MVSPNELTKPDGAADILDNCVIDFDNTVQSRRGFGEFGNKTDDDTVVKQLMTYKGRIIRHFSNKLSFDSTGNGSFLNFSGNYSELIERLRIKYFELNSNLYFTSSEGIKKISATSADDFTTASGFITNAGAVKALGLEGIITPNVAGFLPAQSKVAYKVLWAKKDANGNIIRGVPSSRLVVTNTSKDINAGEEFTIAVTTAGATVSGINNTHFFTFDTPTNKYACWFNISGSDVAPTDTALVGRDLKEVEIYKIATKNKENYMAKIAETLNTVLDISVTVTSTKITVTNIDGGNVLNASGGNTPITYLVVSTVLDGQTAIGTPANVNLSFIVPTQIITDNDKQYFYEIYRTAPITVATGLTLNDIDPGEEFQKIAEYPVTENSNPIPSIITYEDVALESFRIGGIFLYTNPVTGEGALQSNEPPPIAHDVAVFKGSAFYANTKERHRLQFNLLSVSQFISGTSKLYIGNSQTLREYTFVGQNEIIEFTAKKKSETTGGSYFDIWSAQNRVKYRVWFDKGTITHSFTETAINDATDEITITNHGFATNDKVSISGTSLPGGLTASTYYAIRISDNTFKLTTTVDGLPSDLSAVAGTASITHTSEIPASDSALLLKVALAGYPDTIQGSVDAFIDAFFDILDFEVSNISHEFDSLTDVDSLTNFITIPAHGFENGNTVTFSGTSPTGLTNDTVYYIVEKTTDTFKVSLTSGGAGIDITAIAGTSRIAQNTIKLIYTDNGEASAVTQSSPTTGWADPTLVQDGFGEDASQNEVLLSGLASQGLSIIDTARSLERVINKDSNSPVNAYYISGENDLPGLILLESKTLLNDAFYLGFSHATDKPVFEPSLPVIKTVTDVLTPGVFTTSSNHSLTAGQQIYTFIKPTSLPVLVSGKKIVATTPALTTFSISGFTTTSSYSSFDQAIIFPADVVSDNSVNPNRVYFSKIQQPEAVPLVNYIDIGPRDKAIQRIMALRDSLVVLKEDGVYIISGPSAPNFSVRLSDSSALTYAPDTATNLNNLIYVLTSQGVATVSETGVGVISRNIENKIQEVANAKFNYKFMSWGVSSESDRCYILWLPEKTTDMYATQAFRYNTFTRTWTRWTKPANCGVVNPADDKIYLGDASNRPYVLKERKNFERQDYADREIVRGIGTNAINGLVYTISSVAELEPGDSLVQYQYLDINKFNRFLKKLDRDSLMSNDYYTSLKAVTGDSLATKLANLVDKLHLDGVMVPAVSNSENATNIRDDYNAIVNYLNSPIAPTGFKNYKLATDLLVYETLVTGVVSRLNTITVKYSTKFVQGDVSFFKAIKCLVQYAPQHFGKPEATKQIADGTFIFDQNNFWGGEVAYASDRAFDFAPITFTGKGSGFWDGYSWANVVYGGEGNEVPVRTLIPRDKSRCRYLHVQFKHNNAREEWKLIGVSLEPREVSTRGYR